MPIFGFVQHIMNFHGKASRLEFILMLTVYYAYAASLFYCNTNNITFDIGVIGFAIFILLPVLFCLTFASVVCRRNTSAGLPEHYLALWMACQFVPVFLGHFNGPVQILVYGSYFYSLGYIVVLAILPPKYG